MAECNTCGVPIDNGRRRRCDDCKAKPDPRCKKCKKVKALSQFSQDASRPNGHFPWCMSCQGTSTSQFQNADDPLNGKLCPLCDTPVRGRSTRLYCSTSCKDRVARLRRNYNLSPEQYRALVAANKGRCPICTKRATSWQVDHNHKTGKVYGAVCIACNVGSLAHTYHDIAYARRLLAFLENCPADQLGIVAIAPKTAPSNIHKVWNHKRGRAR